MAEFTNSDSVEREVDLNDQDDEDDDDDECLDDTQIQLGFIDSENLNSLFLKKNWKEWDGGFVGGKPIWLHRKILPKNEQLQCSHCQNPMTFILQIYCPLDSPESAFHRCFYLFCCRKSECLRHGSILCLRSQIPQANEFYPMNPTEDEVDYITHSDGVPLCALCGAFGSHRCAKCHLETYCSRSHQKLDWSRHKLLCGNAEASSADLSVPRSLNAGLFPSYGLVIEEETLTENGEEQSQQTVPQEDKNPSSHEGDGTLAIENQSSLSDPVYVKFLTRVSLGGSDQVLRYFCREAKAEGMAEGEIEGKGSHGTNPSHSHRSEYPLPVSSAGYAPLDSIPNCQACGGKRTFEFQLMPQLLHYLQVDANTRLGTIANPSVSSSAAPALTTDDVFRNITQEDIDWGSLDVFTCVNSCAPSEGESESDPRNHYLPEFIWRQPPPLENTMI